MVLRATPRIPTQGDVLRMAVSKTRRVPAEWEAYLPEATRALVGGDMAVAQAREG